MSAPRLTNLPCTLDSLVPRWRAMRRSEQTIAETSPGERWIPALLVLLTVAAMWPLLSGEFTIWDDRHAIVQVPWLNPPALGNFAEFWNPRHPFMDIWIPLTYTVWSALAAISYVPTADPDSGAHFNPWIFHGANLLVHVAGVLVVYAILRRLVGKAWPAAAGAALFAIHPVQVEPVGWLSGMKDVLAGCLGLIAIWQYLHFAGPGPAPLHAEKQLGEQPSWKHYGFATAAFVLAMLAKPSAVVLPLVIGALDLFLLRRPIRRVMLSLLPWLLLAAPIMIEAKYAQPTLHLQPPPLPLRPLIAADALAFYLYKLFFPLRLGIVYGRTPDAALAYHWPYYTWIAPAVVVMGAWIFRKRYPWLIAAVGVYWLALLSVLGLVPFDFQAYSTVADHYLYLAMLGPALAVAFALESIRARAAYTAVGAVLFLLAARSFVQAWTWHDSVSLFRNSVAVNRYACGSYNNLAETYRSRHEYPVALGTFEEGLAYNPDCVALRVGYASLLASLDKDQEARRQFQLAARTATGEYARAIRQSLTLLDKKASQTATKPSPEPHLTPGPAPIK